MLRVRDGRLERWFATSTLTHRQVFALFVPVAVSQAWIVGQAVLNPILVASTGTAAVNAVSTVEYLSMLFTSILMALAAAGSVLVAQYSGARDAAGVRRTVVSTVWAAALPGLAVGVGLLLAQDVVLAALLGPLGPESVELGRTYLVAAALSYPAFGAIEGTAAVLRGTSRTRASLELVVVMHGSYVALATALVLGGGMGVLGLGVALVASRWAAIAFAVFQLRRHGLVDPGRAAWRPRAGMIRRVTWLGLPFVVEQLFFNGGKLIVQVLVVGLGAGQVTINAIVVSLTMFSEIAAAAMGITLIPLVGHAVGARRFDEARRIATSFLVASIVVMVAVCLVMLAFFDQILDLYRTPEALRADITLIFTATIVARLLGWWSASFILPSALRAAGDSVFTTAIASVSMVLRVVAIWFVGVHLGHGVVGVWFVMMAEWGARGLAFWLRFHGHAWESKGWTS